MTDATAVPSLRRRESLALAVGALAFVVVAVAGIPVMHLTAVPIAGDGSLGRYTALASGVIALAAFAAGTLLARPAGARVTILEVLDVVAMALGSAVIATLTWTLVAAILAHAFIGAEVYAFPALLVAGAIAAITAYGALLVAAQLDLQLLAILIAVLTSEGLLASMITASDPHWWLENLSALGATDDFSAFLFNATLVVAGAIITVLSRRAVDGLPLPSRSASRWVRGCLIVIGVFLACVGIFHVDDFFLIHNTVATGMAVAYAVLVVGLRWWMPQLSGTFHLLGWVFVAVLAVLGVFFATGYYTLTAVELVAALLIFSWLVLLLRSIAAAQVDARSSHARRHPTLDMPMSSF